MNNNLSTFPSLAGKYAQNDAEHLVNVVSVLLDIERWKKDFEKELREIMEKVKPQRDLNEYNVYYFIKALLGEQQ